jgi:ankyrin repeat protein
MSHPMTNPESLPPELVIQVLQHLPVSDIIPICESSRYLNSFCHDWTLWAEKARHEFKFPRDQFTQTYLRLPIQRYQQVRTYHDHPDNFLITAARSGNTKLIEYLVDVGVDKVSIILDAIEIAAARGNVNMLRSLLGAFHLPKRNTQGKYDAAELEKWTTWARNSNLSFVDFAGTLSHALELATKNNHLATVQELIQTAVVQELIQMGDHYFDSALMAAGFNGYTDIVQVILEHTPSNNQLGNLNALLIGAAAGGQVNLVNMAIQNGATDLDSALAAAAEQGQIGMIDLLRQSGAQDLNRALREAARHNRVATIQHLIQAGATDLYGALNAAASTGQLESIENLLQQCQRGAMDLNLALYFAASGHNLDVIRTLIQAGATDLNTALRAAARSGNLSNIKELIHAGATNIRDAAYAAKHSIHSDPEVDEYFESLLGSS